MDVVTQIITVRARALDGQQRMIAASAMAHGALLAILAVAPSVWLGVEEPAPEVPVMTISLGGPEGPRTGLTTMGGRPIQTQAVEAKKAIEPVRPPAAREPEMIEPKKAAQKKNEAKLPTDPKDPRSRTPTKGAEVRPGSTVAETGARGQGFGLSAGGGGPAGHLDVANFCCPEYLTMMIDLINRNWSSKQQAAGTTVVRFVIQRDGQLTDVMVERSSGYPALDLLANRAILLTRKLPPLPQAFTEPSLTVHLIFEYQR